ncbi:MAG: DDE-type integrase/transposase/recombinase [Candidatus Entotheonellia bacterium]
MFLQQGTIFTHETVREWESKLALLLRETQRKRRSRGVGKSWYVDETAVKVQGQWCYRYRAIDRDGNLVDVRLSVTRDLTAAETFFRSAWTVRGVTPDRITTDGHDAYPRAMRTVFGERVTHRHAARGNRCEGVGSGNRTPCGDSATWLQDRNV